MATGNPVLLRSGSDEVSPLTRVSILAGESSTYSEAYLQNLIDRCPQLVPLAPFFPNATQAFSFGTEIHIQLADQEPGRIDNLLVTDDGHMVIVETKLHRNPQAIREVVAQALHYCMALSDLTPSEFEAALRTATGLNRLAVGQTIAERLRPHLANPLAFEAIFDRFRETGEILLIVLGDGIRLSASRLVDWMNKDVGGRPYRFGLVELQVHDLPETGRIIIPHTLLQTREASRQVVEIRMSAEAKAAVVYKASSAEGVVTEKTAPIKSSITEEALYQAAETDKNPRALAILRNLIAEFRSVGLVSRPTTTTLQFCAEIQPEDLVPLVTLTSGNIWVELPIRAVKALGAENYVAAKTRINQVAPFYRQDEVSQTDKTNALTPRYAVVDGKEKLVANALAQVGDLIRLSILAGVERAPK